MSDIVVAGRKIRTRPIGDEGYYNGNYDYVINISSVADKDELELIFEQGGTFSYEDIKIILNSYDEFEHDYNTRLNHCLRDAYSTNGRITGVLDESTDGYLMVNLPYSKKWSCYIDGEKSELLRADYSFMACFVPKGAHTIVFVYK